MDHAQARDLQAVEKYLLGQLPPDECEAFEEHFFACRDCAEDLRLAAIFEVNARAVFEENPVHSASAPPAQGWLATLLASWRQPVFAVPAFAAALLCAVAGYQNLVTIPALRSQSAVGVSEEQLAVLPVRAASRGASSGDSERSFQVPKGAKSFLLQFYAGWENPAANLDCEIQDSSGRVVFRLAIRSAENGMPDALRVPTSSVFPGAWVLVVRDLAGSKPGPERSRYPFTYRIE